jgi:hypothetical protein
MERLPDQHGGQLQASQVQNGRVLNDDEHCELGGGKGLYTMLPGHAQTLLLLSVEKMVGSGINHPGSDHFFSSRIQTIFSSRILYEKWNANLLFLASYAFRSKVLVLVKKIRDPGGKNHRILDPDPQHCCYFNQMFRLFCAIGTVVRWNLIFVALSNNFSFFLITGNSETQQSATKPFYVGSFYTYRCLFTGLHIFRGFQC